jgi:PBP1b-binding outer membrane lipoprotein LpoB
MKRVLSVLILASACVMAGCSEPEPEGVYVEIDLQNSKNINSFILFNPNIKTMEECEASMDGALPSIMGNLPPQVPADSKALGWKCHLTDPRKSVSSKT